jgi:hypothetical protein
MGLEFDTRASSAATMKANRPRNEANMRPTGESEFHHNVTDDFNREPDFSDAVLAVLRFLWSARLWMLGGFLLALVLSVAYFLFTGITKPSVTSYRTAIILTMIGNQDGKYTSGLSYSPNDLRSPAVLTRVYDDNRIADYGVRLSDFASAISIQPYSPTLESTASRFRTQLANTRLTPEERSRLEEQYRNELTAAESHGVTVSFTAPSSWGIPESLGIDIVNDVPKLWADVYVDVLGVSSITNMRTNTELVDLTRIRELDYPLGYDYIESSLERLLERLNDLAAISVIQNASLDPKTPSVADLQRSAQDFEAINIRKILQPLAQVGITRDAEVTSLTFEERIRQLERDEQLAKQRAQIVESARAEESGLNRPDAAANSGSNAGLQQFDAGFLDRIVGLSVSEAGVAYRQSLLDKQIDFSQLATTLASDRAELQQRLNAMRRFDPTQPQAVRLTERFALALDDAAVSINEMWDQSKAIVLEVGDNLIATQGRLYRPIPLPESVETSQFWSSSFLWLAILLMLFAFPMIGLCLFVLFRFVMTQGTAGRGALDNPETVSDSGFKRKVAAE